MNCRWWGGSYVIYRRSGNELIALPGTGIGNGLTSFPNKNSPASDKDDIVGKSNEAFATGYDLHGSSDNRTATLRRIFVFEIRDEGLAADVWRDQQATAFAAAGCQIDWRQDDIIDQRFTKALYPSSWIVDGGVDFIVEVCSTSQETIDFAIELCIETVIQLPFHSDGEGWIVLGKLVQTIFDLARVNRASALGGCSGCILNNVASGRQNLIFKQDDITFAWYSV